MDGESQYTFPAIAIVDCTSMDDTRMLRMPVPAPVGKSESSH